MFKRRGYKQRDSKARPGETRLKPPRQAVPVCRWPPTAAGFLVPRFQNHAHADCEHEDGGRYKSENAGQHPAAAFSIKEAIAQGGFHHHSEAIVLMSRSAGKAATTVTMTLAAADRVRLSDRARFLAAHADHSRWAPSKLATKTVRCSISGPSHGGRRRCVSSHDCGGDRAAILTASWLLLRWRPGHSPVRCAADN